MHAGRVLHGDRGHGGHRIAAHCHHGLDVGLTCAIWSRDLAKAHRAANRVEAGFVWINEVGKHFLGAPFGGVKQSGIGREEGIGELLSFTHEKNIHINLSGQ